MPILLERIRRMMVMVMGIMFVGCVREIQHLAKKNPTRASWNAANYENYAEAR